MLLIKQLSIKTTLCRLSYTEPFTLKLSLTLARSYSDSVYYDRAREFKDPNFSFSESCTKKNALTKLARMSRVRHNAKSI